MIHLPQKDFAHSSFHVPPMILSSLIHYAEQHQWSYQDWFSSQQLDLENIQQGQSFVAFQDLCTVIRQALQNTAKPHLGVLLGSSEGQVSMGILGFAMQACKTVAQAMETALYYHPISGSVLDISFQVNERYCEIELTSHLDCNELNAFFYDEAFSSIISCLNMILGDHKELVNLQLSYDHSEYLMDYQHVFACPIQFNQPRNIIRFGVDILHRPLKNYSPVNYQTAIQICDQALERYQRINQRNLTHVIQHLIESHLPERFDMQQVSQHFHLSERHLRRLLLSEGINFQSLKQQTLEKKAKQWILEDLSISEISFNLGFSELREFRRAFKKWTGYSPTAFKKTKLMGSVFE